MLVAARVNSLPGAEALLEEADCCMKRELELPPPPPPPKPPDSDCAPPLPPDSPMASGAIAEAEDAAALCVERTRSSIFRLESTIMGSVKTPRKGDCKDPPSGVALICTR